MTLPVFFFSITPEVGGGTSPASTESPKSSGKGGKLFRPSYHVISTGGIFPRFGNLNTNVEACGKMYGLCPSICTGSTSYGKPNFKNSWAVSNKCAPQSPKAPFPKSYHDRQLPSTYP